MPWEGQQLSLVSGFPDQWPRLWYHQTFSIALAFGKRGNACVPGHKGILFKIVSSPARGQSLALQSSMEAGDDVIAHAAAQLDFEVHAGNAFLASEQLVDRHPELALAVAFLRVLEAELAVVAGDSLGQVCGKAPGCHPEIERLRFIKDRE
jgi:hypothetical protein